MRLIPQSVRYLWRECSRLTRVTIYFAVVEAVLLLAQFTVRRAHISRGTTLGSWTMLLGAVLAVLLLILATRWFRRKVMWRLRNRLVVTYVFVGVIPVVLLVAMAIIAGWGFAGQFASYVMSSDIATERKTVQAANNGVAEAVASQVQSGAPAARAAETVQALPAAVASGSITITVAEKSSIAQRTVPANARPVSLTPPVEKKLTDGHFEGLVVDGGRLYMRAVTAVDRPTGRTVVISSVPVEKGFVEKLAANLGEVSFLPPERKGSIAEKTNKALRSDEVDHETRRERRRRTITAGTLPPRASFLDAEIPFAAQLDVTQWETGEEGLIVAVVRSRPSMLYGRVVETIGQLSGSVLILLIAVAIFFAVIELVAIIIGVRLTRTMTRSVAQLYDATQRVNRGDFRHRIRVESADQLAALETSFNSMTESLEQLIAEQKEKQRMESELAIAQEVQAQLFPRDVKPIATLEMRGVCRPARTVSGDYYDFLPLGSERLGLAVGDISGKGISAALLMATIHSAVRVYEMGRTPSREQHVAAGAAVTGARGANSVPMVDGLQSPAEVMTLLNRHIFRSTPMEKYATMFLAVWDGTRHTLTYCNAGHLPPLVICRDGSIQRLTEGGTVVGLFDNQQYEEATVQLGPGDLFVAYSDGVTEPENEFGEFGEERLLEVLQEQRGESLVRISESVMQAVADWIGAGEQPDDVTLVLARAR